ncbi:hypothetical protein Clacol_008315 [Clathrus columnatus]|uniref:Uncharacterized protein n=1 Tax=Clathrus columnatus TaxID=1419009 RepID=A0AAV5AKN8_9AGAM|nr:hypothetical protein Clacol_008315 [Clathrus columnatus]
MRSTKSLFFAALFSIGYVVNAGPAETSFTTVVEAGHTIVETEVISIVGASGPTTTVAIFNAANGITLTATLILAPTEEIVTEDIDQPGEISHEHLDCKFSSDGSGQCIETLSASEAGSTISTVVTFASTIPPPSPAPSPTPAPSQSSKSGSPSPSPSQTASSNPKPSSSGTAASTSSSSSTTSSSSQSSTPSTSPSSNSSTAVSPSSNPAPVASPTSPTSPISPPSTNSTDEPPVTVTSTNGTLTPPDNAAGAVGPNFLGAIAFLALIFGMM